MSMDQESSDDLPLAQRAKGPQDTTARRKDPAPAGAKQSTSHVASSGAPANGAARKPSAAAPAEEKQAAPKGNIKGSAKASGKGTTQAEAKKIAKAKVAKSAAAVQGSERSGECEDAKNKPVAASTKKAGQSSQISETKPAKAAKASAAATSPDKVKREKPQYDLPGQTQPTPDSGEPLAKFYLSLLKQRPDSEIAPKWCVQRGLLSREDAEAWLQKNGKSTGKPARKPATSSPSKPKPPPKRPAKQAVKQTKPAARRKKSEAFGENDSDDEEDDDEYREDAAKPAKKKAKPAAGAKPSKAKPAQPKPKPTVAKPPKVAERTEQKVPNVADPQSDSSSDDLPLAQRRKQHT